MEKIQNYVAQGMKLLLRTLEELCHIPAPSHREEKRAAYCKSWLESAGATGVYIDRAQNVIFPVNCEYSKQITVFAAHTDTVFPDLSPMPYRDDGDKIHCPGAADDTASVAVLLMMARYFIEHRIAPRNGILFVLNACEEGLGNLKGTRQLFADYGGRIKQFITFDSQLGTVNDRCVGSHRYAVEVLTEGGHSFTAFGNDNAIARLSQIVTEIYQIDIPREEGSTTTYNVGTITGGTSVNTIAQNAKMLCEYRSDNNACLTRMEEKFREIFKNAQTEKVCVQVTRVGERPCSITPQEKIDALKNITLPIIEEVTGQPVICRSASTDCNIPLSLGVPALCVGVDVHHGTHTREEWVQKDSLFTGLQIAIRLGIALTEVEV